LRLCSFVDSVEVKLGVRTERGIVDVAATAANSGMVVPNSLQELIVAGGVGEEQLLAVLQKELVLVSEEKVKFAPPLSSPEKVICVGLNYEKHAKEGGMPIPEFPIYFAKYANSLSSHKEEIVLTEYVKKVDYEVELIVVMGKEAKDVSKEEALDFVYGYSTGNDYSVRELQSRNSQWMYGKAIDQFAPFGPYIVTADEVPDPQNLDLKLWVNGDLRQNSNTADMIFSVADIVSDLSKVMTLKPGDVIFTGTPEGVILGMEEKVWLKAGDNVVCEIGDFGQLENDLISQVQVKEGSEELVAKA